MASRCATVGRCVGADPGIQEAPCCTPGAHYECHQGVSLNLRRLLHQVPQSDAECKLNVKREQKRTAKKDAQRRTSATTTGREYSSSAKQLKEKIGRTTIGAACHAPTRKVAAVRSSDEGHRRQRRQSRKVRRTSVAAC